MEFAAESGPNDTEERLERLRRLERCTALTVQRLLEENRIGEASALRIQHAAMIKGLFDAETKAMRLAQERGKLIPVEVALDMITESLREVTLMLRQLPEMGRDESEREKLSAFSKGCLEAIRTGAEAGFNAG